MKKTSIFAGLLLTIMLQASAQIDTIIGHKGKELHYNNYPVPNSLLGYFTAYGTWGSFYDTARAAFTGTANKITISSGVINIGSSVVTLTDAQTLTNKTLTSPVINVGSDATGDMYYRNSGGILTRLAVGTGAQHLLGGTIPHWGDTTAGGGSSGWNLTGNSSTDSALNFLGTTDSKVLKLQTKGINAAVVDTMQRMLFGNIAQAPVFDSAFIQMPWKGISFRRMSTPLLTAFTLKSHPTTNEFEIKGNSSGFIYTESGTNMFRVTNSGQGIFASTITGTTITATSNSGVNANFYNNNGTGVVQLSNNVQIGGSGYIYSTQSTGPTAIGIKFTAWNQPTAAYIDRWHIFQSGSLSSSGTENPRVKLHVSSTNQGLLPPVQTTAQRDAGGIATGSLTAGGSGYTNGSYTSKLFTGGSGSGALATITVSGGAVTSVTVTYSGAGYNATETLSASGIGAGTGFVWTVSTLVAPPAGLTIYCSDCTANDASTGVMQTYNGTTWKSYW